MARERELLICFPTGSLGSSVYQSFISKPLWILLAGLIALSVSISVLPETVVLYVETRSWLSCLRKDGGGGRVRMHSTFDGKRWCLVGSV